MLVPLSSHNCTEEKKQDSQPENAHDMLKGNSDVTKSIETSPVRRDDQITRVHPSPTTTL